jgi:uncharacterized membrane protein YjfL (UPF0719 family)
MTSIKKAILYGFLVWLIPFAFGFLLFPLHESNRIFFEALMPVSVAFSSALFGFLYLRSSSKCGRESILLGLIWIAMSIGIDLALFLSPSPMQMPLLAYLEDIGVTYLMIPIIVMGIGFTKQCTKR